MQLKQNRITIILAAVVLLSLALSACTGGATTSIPAPTTKPPATATPVPPTEEPVVALEGTYWKLLSYVDDQGNAVDVLADASIDAEFTADQMVGNAGCNRYFATYQTDDTTLTLGPVGATRMACIDPVNAQEMRYFQALESVATYKVADDHLYLSNTEGVTVLTFARAEAPVASEPAWTADTLKNAAYTLEDLGDVQLVDGEYTHQYGDGASMVDNVSVVDVVLGDLDGNGDDDAAVILVWQSGGSGSFLYLVAMRNDDGTPQQAGIISLGDRVQPGSFTITDGTIVLEVLTHGPDDPMCCPSQKTIQTYALEGDTLKLVSTEAATP
jgi:heat shock protein HslJ